MIAPDKKLWDAMSANEKIDYLKTELKSIKEVAEKHYRQNAGSRPRLSGVEACTWITNEINGLFKTIG